MILNALRNKVAHKLDYKFSDADKLSFFDNLPGCLVPSDPP